MALQITKTLDTSVVVTYFQIIRVVVKPFSESVTIGVEAYVSNSACISGSKPALSSSYEVELQTAYAAFGTQAAVPAAYAFLKTLPYFAGALDV